MSMYVTNLYESAEIVFNFINMNEVTFQLFGVNDMLQCNAVTVIYIKLNIY